MLKVAFLGDTCFSGVFSDQAVSPESRFAPEIRTSLLHMDHVVANLEGSLTKARGHKKRGSVLRSHPSAATVLEWLGVSILNLANNHTMDCGVQGLEDTLSVLASSGLRSFGAGWNLAEASRPITLVSGNVRACLVAACHREGMLAGDHAPGVFYAGSGSHLERIVRAAKAEHDWVILNYHGGEEFTHVPMPARRRLFRRFQQWGADIIIAHHAHVVQGYEYVEDGFVAYSLGNFMLDTPYQRAHDDTEESVALQVTLGKEGFKVEPLFTKIDRTAGTVQSIPDNCHFRPLQSRGYRRAWNAECYRLVRPRGSREPGGTGVPGIACRRSVRLAQGPRARRLLSPSIWLRVLRVLRNQSTRARYLGAALHLVSTKAGFR